MSIFQGSNEVSEIYVGSTPVKEVYQGSNLVWSATIATLTGSLGWSAPGGNEKLDSADGGGTLGAVGSLGTLSRVILRESSGVVSVEFYVTPAFSDNWFTEFDITLEDGTNGVWGTWTVPYTGFTSGGGGTYFSLSNSGIAAAPVLNPATKDVTLVFR